MKIREKISKMKTYLNIIIIYILCSVVLSLIGQMPFSVGTGIYGILGTGIYLVFLYIVAKCYAIKENSYIKNTRILVSIFATSVVAIITDIIMGKMEINYYLNNGLVNETPVIIASFIRIIIMILWTALFWIIATRKMIGLKGNKTSKRGRILFIITIIFYTILAISICRFLANPVFPGAIIKNPIKLLNITVFTLDGIFLFMIYNGKQGENRK